MLLFDTMVELSGDMAVRSMVQSLKTTNKLIFLLVNMKLGQLGIGRNDKLYLKTGITRVHSEFKR